MHASCSPWQMRRLIVFSFLPMALAFGSMFGTKKTSHIRFGRSERTALIFIPCLAGDGGTARMCPRIKYRNSAYLPGKESDR